jgi:Transketolase, N-terminal subunit
MTSKELAWKIRRHGIEMTHISHGSHIGAILSVADIVAVLYNDVLCVHPDNPKAPSRDRFILSKGHAGAAVYAALAEKGFFDVEELKTHYLDGSRLSGHVSHKNVPGVELSTGSLGHGIGVGSGMALVAKMDDLDFRVFVIMGDGECNEGSVWEAALFANHHKLSNLVVVIDHNKLQSLDLCENTIKLENLGDKWRQFGWHVVEVDGHDHVALYNALESSESDSPTCVIANTIKGKGVSFMEGEVLWHYRDPQGELYDQAVQELEDQRP